VHQGHQRQQSHSERLEISPLLLHQLRLQLQPRPQVSALEVMQVPHLLLPNQALGLLVALPQQQRQHLPFQLLQRADHLNLSTPLNKQTRNLDHLVDLELVQTRSLPSQAPDLVPLVKDRRRLMLRHLLRSRGLHFLGSDNLRVNLVQQHLQVGQLLHLVDSEDLALGLVFCLRNPNPRQVHLDNLRLLQLHNPQIPNQTLSADLLNHL